MARHSKKNSKKETIVCSESWERVSMVEASVRGRTWQRVSVGKEVGPE